MAKIKHISEGEGAVMPIPQLHDNLSGNQLVPRPGKNRSQYPSPFAYPPPLPLPATS
jgi:hypothetical protein